MTDYLIDYALPIFITTVSGWMLWELIAANRDCGRFRDIE